MNDEQYCRVTAEACGYALAYEPGWDVSGGKLAACSKSSGFIWWHPHTNVAQALESARTRFFDIKMYRDHVEAQDPNDNIGACPYYEESNDTAATVCAAVKACWEAGV